MISACFWLVALIPVFVQSGFTIDPPRRSRQPTGNWKRLLTYNETTPSAKVRPLSTLSIRWYPAGQDGEYTTINNKNGLVLALIAAWNTTTLVSADKLPNNPRTHWVRYDGGAVLVAANYTAQYRHSYFADYFVVDIQSGASVAVAEDQAGDLQYAVFAPQGKAIAFVRGNNVFLKGGASNIHQITHNGGPVMFNGVPDWVYEEEILSDRSALWFSPDAKYIAFLSFNEMGVGTYRIPYYMAGQKVAPRDPKDLELRYPKVGTTNPTVQLNILDVKTKKTKSVPIDAFARNDTIVREWRGLPTAIRRSFTASSTACRIKRSTSSSTLRRDLAKLLESGTAQMDGWSHLRPFRTSARSRAARIAPTTPT